MSMVNLDKESINFLANYAYKLHNLGKPHRNNTSVDVYSSCKNATEYYVSQDR